MKPLPIAKHSGLKAGDSFDSLILEKNSLGKFTSSVFIDYIGGANFCVGFLFRL